MWVLGWFTRRLKTRISLNGIFSLNSRKIGIFEFHLLSYFVKLWDSLSSLVCVYERESQFVIKLPVFKKRNVHVYAIYLCRYITTMKTCSVYHWNQNRNKTDYKCSSLQYRYLSVYLYLIIKLCLFV